jgi:hypothetical protein
LITRWSLKKQLAQYISRSLGPREGSIANFEKRPLPTPNDPATQKVMLGKQLAEWLDDYAFK